MSGDKELLSRLGVVSASTSQVETSVIEQMQQNLAKKKLESIKNDINALQMEFDAFPRKREVILANPAKKKIKDPLIRSYYQKYQKLKKLHAEYKSLKDGDPPPTEQVGEKRHHTAQLPGNLKKRQRKETEQERQIRTGKLTPFAHIPKKGSTNAKGPRIIDLSQPEHKPLKKGNVKFSSVFSNAGASKESSSSVIIKKKGKKGEKGKEMNMKQVKSKRSTTITQSVPDFVEESNNVVLEGGYKLPKRVYEKLFEHQKTSVKWLWELYRSEVGGIVADEMGLGKTIQVVAFMAGLQYSKKNKLPSIIVCPTTIMRQWRLEFEKWWPHLRVEVLHSSESNDFTELLETVAADCGIIITSYGTLQALREEILPYEFEVVVLDEGHKIRNPDSLITITCKQFRSPNRIILTGAPIQNNLKELWSLFDFIFPGKLGTLPVFKQNFEVPIRMGGYSNANQLQVQTAYNCAVILRDEINPFLLRRMKADVQIGLPEKFEQVLFCPLLEEQKEAYKKVLASDYVSKVLIKRGNILAAAMQLRKICNHPDLALDPGEEPPNYGEPERSGKMSILSKLLPVWKQEGHRCLIFTQTRRLLDMLELFCNNMEFTYLRMDGNTSISHRPGMIQQYQDDPDIFAFIMTTKTGGIGVNLTKADRIILYDPDWNPTTDIQARERAWRIGQKNSVTIYRLITTGTIEEKIYQRQIYKQFLSNKILKDPRQKRLFHSQIMRDLFSYMDPDDGGITETCDLFQASRVHIEEEEEEGGGGRGGEEEQNMWQRITEKSKDPKKGVESPEEMERIVEEIEQEKEAKEKKNILADLLSSSGVKNILSHDSVIGNSGHERIIVIQEAKAAAEKAAKALEASAKSCIAAAVNVPTWTGNSGKAGKFGKESHFSPFPRPSLPSPSSIRNFGGPEKPIGATWGTPTATTPSISTSLLQRLAQMNEQKENSSQAESHSLSPSSFFHSPTANNGSPSGSSSLVMNKLKEYSAAKKGGAANLTKDPGNNRMKKIANKLHKVFDEYGGNIASDDLLSHFSTVTAEKEKIFFKNLLRTIATLDKRNHVWVLKDKYRKEA